MSRFERDTAPTASGPGRYTARMDTAWWIVNGPNGGYLAAVLLRAMQAEVADPERTPRALTIHYLRPPQEGEVEIGVALERSGRTVTNVTARVSQSGKLQLLATAAFATLRGGPSFQDARMPEVPAPEDLPGGGPPQIRMHEQYDRRWLWGVSPGAEPPPVPAQGQAALCGGWIRLADPRPYDAALIAALTDSWPPAIYQRRLARSPGGSPTLDLTIHLRAHERIAALEPEDWVLARFESRMARDGFLEEDGEIWSRDGVLLAQSRQLAVLR